MMVALTLGSQGISGCPFRGTGNPDRATQRQEAADQEAALREAVARAPNNPEVNLALAKVLAREMKTQEAVHYFDQTRILDPARQKEVEKERLRHVTRYQDEAQGFLAVSDLDTAERLLGQAEIMLPYHGRTFFLRGQIFQRREGWTGAVPLFRMVSEADPGTKEYREILARALFLSGGEHYQAKEYALAWRALTEVRHLQPGPDVDYLGGLVAYAWAQQSETDRAEHLHRARAAFEAVLDQDPDHEDAAFNLGAVYLSASQFKASIKIYREMVSRNPRDGRLYLALARAHGLSGEDETALALDAVGRALRTGDPVGNPKIWAHRGRDRFPDTDLSAALEEYGPPESVYTYSLPGGSLVEIWCYWKEDLVLAYREGTRIGAPIALP